MKFLVVLAVAVACAQAVSPVKTDEPYAAIVKSDYQQTPEGSFQYVYETANGIAAQAEGFVKNPNSEYPSLAIKGGYKYVSPEGVPVEVTYEADEEGFKPASNVLPVAPAIPELIARSLAYIASHPPAVEAVKPAAYKPPTPSYG